MRNPWRYSFDSATGRLYLGDVGQDTWEEVDIVVKGGNYGWSYREASHPGSRTAPAGFTSIDPIAEYHHGSATNQGNAVIGGVVYRGSRISQLAGAYVFADNVSGNIWMLRYDGINTTPFTRIAGNAGISAFGVDPSNGDVLIADQSADTIKRLVYNAAVGSGTPLPPTLAETGAFQDLPSLTVNPGIVAYEINAPFWSDNAQKSRWLSVPDASQTVAFNPTGSWSFPAGSVWIKHFELELTNGVPESRRRLETRFLVRNAAGVYGVTYRWGNSLTNATLVPEAGLDESFVVHDGGNTRTQVWHYPGRTECLSCHTTVGGLALGMNTAQMNREHDYGAGPESQIAALSRVGYFASPVANVSELPALASVTNTAYSREYRVHSYLAANCAQCHQPGGSAIANWDARLSTPLSGANVIDGLLYNDLGDPNHRVIAPGSLVNSTLLTRISTRGQNQMPPLATTLLDTNAMNLLSAWITNDLPAYQSFAQWQLANFGTTNAPNAAPTADPDQDGANNYLEYLTGSNPQSGGDAWKVAVRQNGNAVEISFPQVANRGFVVEWTASLSAPIVWQPVALPTSQTFFAPTNSTAVVADTISDAPFKFYRVRVVEP